MINICDIHPEWPLIKYASFGVVLINLGNGQTIMGELNFKNGYFHPYYSFFLAENCEIKKNQLITIYLLNDYFPNCFYRIIGASTDYKKFNPRV